MKKVSDYDNTQLKLRFDKDDDDPEGFYYIAKRLDGTYEEVPPKLAMEIEERNRLRHEVLFIETENLLKIHSTDTK